MSLTRYAPQIVDGFRRTVTRPAAFARAVVPGAALVLAGMAVRDAGFAGAAQLGLLLNAFGIGAAGFLWSRSLAAPQDDDTPFWLVVRWLLWSVILQMLLGVQLVPAALLGALFEGMPDSAIYVRVGLQVFQMLIGCLFLVLPHLALGRWKELAGTRLQELVIAGGIAVGLGFVITDLPFMAVSEVARAAFQDFAPEATFAAALTDQAIHLLFVTVAAGYFALVWAELQVTHPQRQPVEPAAAAPKPRRTTRINRLNKAKR